MLALQTNDHVRLDTIKSVILVKKFLTEDKTNCPIIINTCVSLSTTPIRKEFEGHISSSTVTHSNGLASQIPVGIK